MSLILDKKYVLYVSNEPSSFVGILVSKSISCKHLKIYIDIMLEDRRVADQ